MPLQEEGVLTGYLIHDAQGKRGLMPQFGHDAAQPILVVLKHGRINKPSVRHLELLLEAVLQREGMPTDAEPLLQPEQRIDALADRLLLEQGRGR